MGAQLETNHSSSEPFFAFCFFLWEKRGEGEGGGVGDKRNEYLLNHKYVPYVTVLAPYRHHDCPKISYSYHITSDQEEHR